MNSFIKELKQYRHILPKQTISTLRGQALSGNVEGAIKGLQTALNKKQSNKDKMINAHRSTRYITRQYDDVDYQAQLRLSLKQ
jgi:type II secretory pathway component PulF